MESPRLAWVIAHATELIEIARRYGATGVCLCGSVARGDDHDGSDIDFFVKEFSAETGPGSHDARRRADSLVAAFRALAAPYAVDVRPLPGWLLGPDEEQTMRAEAIELAQVAP